MRVTSTVLVAFIAVAGCSKSEPVFRPAETDEVHSSDWIAQLPDSEIKRKFIVACTGCHQVGPPLAWRQFAAQWETTIKNMKKTDDELELKLIPFEDGELAKWLGEYGKWPVTTANIVAEEAKLDIFPIGKPFRHEDELENDGFYHDVAVAGGRVWVADYFGNTLYGLDPKTGREEQYPIPVKVKLGSPGGAHAVDTDSDGFLWITFTQSEQVGRFDTTTTKFQMYSGFPEGCHVQYFTIDADRFVYKDEGNGLWVNCFSKELLVRLDLDDGNIETFQTKRTETIPDERAVHLYAVVADSNGILWYTETHGNRLGYFDPKTKANEEWDLKVSWSGPKRLAIDKNDVLWIPHLSTGYVSVFDTKTEKFTDMVRLPIPGDYAYGIRRNRFDGSLWVTGSGSDSLYRLDPESKTFKTYRFEQKGVYTRTVAFTENGEVWTNFSSYPNRFTQLPFSRGGVVRLTFD